MLYPLILSYEVYDNTLQQKGKAWYYFYFLIFTNFRSEMISLFTNDVEHLFYIYFLAIDNPFLLILLILLWFGIIFF